jgi:hypothetical protein
LDGRIAVDLASWINELDRGEFLPPKLLMLGFDAGPFELFGGKGLRCAAEGAGGA